MKVNKLFFLTNLIFAKSYESTDLNPSLSATLASSSEFTKPYEIESEFANKCEHSPFSQCDCDSSVSAVL